MERSRSDERPLKQGRPRSKKLCYTGVQGRLALCDVTLAVFEVGLSLAVTLGLDPEHLFKTAFLRLKWHS